ncbi:MAG: hypothetical protein ACT6RT_25930, partial [Allorhizobium sp.]|uniref:hypothetical protein n=1 Tax=Allorhizobium sp. TaxID=633478 RepID=UPI0040336614
LERVERIIMAPGHWPDVNSLQLGLLLRAGGDLPVPPDEIMLSMQNWFGINPQELAEICKPMIEKEWLSVDAEGSFQTTPLGREVLDMHKSPLTKAVMWSIRSGLTNMEEKNEDGVP